MDSGLTPNDLRRFEMHVFELFQSKKINSPIHLRGGNESELIEIFKKIQPEDYCICTWASHLECLLKGVPESELEAAILRNKSICLAFNEYNILSSAIVGGNGPIAIGIAMAIKIKKEDRRVWCFVGDMAFYTGAIQESIRYAQVHDLPVTFVVADNGLSVTTPTAHCWGSSIKELATASPKCIYYSYKNFFPHAGTGQKVLF
jgi:TPP-dependent pyruvate/acetoin dehydrogenase alpha subunit